MSKKAKMDKVEQGMSQSVKLAVTAVSELSAKLEVLKITESETRAALLQAFLVWNSFVMVDWSAWTNKSPNTSDGEIRRTRDEFLLSAVTWIPQQVDLLVSSGHLALEKRQRTTEVLIETFREMFGLPVLPATKQDDSIRSRILRKLEQEHGFHPSAIRAIQHQMYVVMDKIQNAKKLAR